MIRKILVIPALAAGVMLFAAPAAFACACCGTYHVTGVANGDTLNVRSGPDPSFSVVYQLPPDAACLAPSGERRGDWVWIRGGYSKGDEWVRVEGWVNSKYVRLAE